MPVKTIAIERFSMTYARNGVGGQGGYWCTFEASEEGEEPHRYAGWLWHQCSTGWGGCSDPCESEEPNEASVILIGELVGLSNGGDPDEVGGWRSTDYFLPAILPYFRELRDAWFRGEVRL